MHTELICTSNLYSRLLRLYVWSAETRTRKDLASSQHNCGNVSQAEECFVETLLGARKPQGDESPRDVATL